MVLADVDISQSIQRMLTEFFAFIPEFLAAIAILIIGYFIARVIGNVVARVLARASLDTTATSGQTGAWVENLTSSPSRLVGKLAFWAVFLGVISLAVSVLGINALTEFVGAIFAYLPNVIAAVLIFLVAGAIAAGVATLATKFMGDTPTGKVVATVAPILVMTIATFMILEQLKIAHDIVVTTYTLLLGAVGRARLSARIRPRGSRRGGPDAGGRVPEGSAEQGADQTGLRAGQGASPAGGTAEEGRGGAGPGGSGPRPSYAACGDDGCGHRHDPGPLVIARGGGSGRPLSALSAAVDRDRDVERDLVALRQLLLQAGQYELERPAPLR